jgi:hypothetical protein
MAHKLNDVVWLKRRLGDAWIQIIGANILIPVGLYLRFPKSADIGVALKRFFATGWNGFLFLAVGYLALNIIPLMRIRKALSYRVGYNAEAIYARPFPRSGPYLCMRFDEIGKVEFQSLACVSVDSWGNRYDSMNQIANIRIYSKNGSPSEIFVLISKQLYGKQLKYILQLIWEMHPEALSKDVLRYLKSKKRYPPIALAERDGHARFKW